MSKVSKPTPHDMMVQRVARHLKRRFYRDVRASSGHYGLPQTIGAKHDAYTPDITMLNKEDQFHIFEVETAQGLDRRDGAPKWKIFAEHAAQSGSTFCLVVPKGSGETAEGSLRELGLQARVWEV